MHWILDTEFGEGASRKRAEDREENFARMQAKANVLEHPKKRTELKASIKDKRAKCAMGENYLHQVLTSLV